MDGSDFLFWSFIFISFITSVANLSIMFYIVSKLKRDLLDKNIELNKDRYVFLNRQHLTLASEIKANSVRIENVERILSAIIVGPGGSGFDDTMH